METSTPSLTLKEKVLLWLSHVGANASSDPGLAATQAGIAHGTGMSRAHVSRTIAPLVEGGLVTIEKARVSGISRSLVAYRLAPPGQQVVDDLERSLAPVVVEVRDAADGLERMTLEALRRKAGKAVSVWRILSEAAGVGFVDLQKSAAPVARGTRFHFEASEAPSERFFVGRERELAAFEKWIEDGRGRAAIVEGAPGIGKSTFLAHALRGRPPKAHVLWIRLMEWSSPASVVQAVMGLLSRAGRPGPIPTTDDVEAVLAQFSDRARGIPLLVVVDDVQNASQPVRVLLKAVLSVARQTPTLRVVLAGRQVNLPGETFAEAAVFRLYPLNEKEAAKVAELLGTPPAASAALVRATGGNPLFIELASRGPRPDASPADFAEYLQNVILPSLPEEQRELLQYAAALRVGLRPQFLDALTVGSPSATRALESAGLLAQRADGAYEPHDLVRSTVESTMGFKTRVHVHGRLAEMFRPRGDDATNVSEFLHHLVRAGKREEAARWVFKHQATLMERARGLFGAAV